MHAARPLLCFASLALLVAACGPPQQPEPLTPGAGETKPAASAAVAVCDAGKAECDANPTTSCETDLRSSAAHCGACGSACAVGESCVSGACLHTTTLAAQSAKVCAVVSGHVLCWGDNSSGVIAAGARGPRATPTEIPGIDSAAAVRIGSRFGCAITTTGKLQCFQDGASRELGLVSGVRDAAIQDDTVFIVRKNGEVTGVDLGYSGREQRPAKVPALEGVVAITAGDDHACALHATGEVSCWGDVEYTGSGVDTAAIDFDARQALAKSATKVVGLTDAVQISASVAHTCALRKTKQIVCWGSNWSGELGDGSNDTRRTPVKVELLDDAVEVTAGYHHTCARRASGKVACWGDGQSGQLGSGAVGMNTMVEVRDMNDATAVAAGNEVSCAARASGGIACWGSASRGRLGNGQASEYVAPAQVRGVSGVTALALGDRVSCALNGSKQLACWGKPGYQDAGRGNEPVLLAGLGEVESMTMSGGGLCAITKAKKIHCDSVPKLIKGTKPVDLGAVKAVRWSGSTGGLISASGQAALWARPDWNKPDEVKKQTLTGLSDAVSLAVDGAAACAVRRSGKVGCVGYSYRTFDKKDPVKPAAMIEVPGLTDAVSIAGDSSEMCVVRKTGEVSCFGSYRVPAPVDPKRPTPATKEKPLPIEVKAIKGIEGAVQLALGGGARCAVLKDGTVTCWGSSSQGQLGLGDFEHQWDPKPVPGLTDVATIALGSGQSCVAKKSGEVLCWGRNAEDQAGQAAPAFELAPVAVQLPKAR